MHRRPSWCQTGNSYELMTVVTRVIFLVVLVGWSRSDRSNMFLIHEVKLQETFSS